MGGWVDRNPLRIWRRQKSMGYRRAQQALGFASTASIFAWESGRSVPTPESMQRLAYKMEVSVAALAGAWYEWYLSAPPSERPKRGVPEPGSLTDKQREVLDAVEALGADATIDAVARRVGTTYTWAERHLYALQQKGVADHDGPVWSVREGGRP